MEHAPSHLAESGASVPSRCVVVSYVTRWERADASSSALLAETNRLRDGWDRTTTVTPLPLSSILFRIVLIAFVNPVGAT